MIPKGHRDKKLIPPSGTTDFRSFLSERYPGMIKGSAHDLAQRIRSEGRPVSAVFRLFHGHRAREGAHGQHMFSRAVHGHIQLHHAPAMIVDGDGLLGHQLIIVV